MTKDEIIAFAQNSPGDFKQIVWDLGFAVSNQEWAENCKLQAMAKYKATLRDDFAKSALAGLLANAEAIQSDGWSWRSGTLAGDAYLFADDALKAREN